jgi:hypothetical protein
MHLVLYSDSGYESMVDSFLISRKYAGVEYLPVIYYSVGFDSVLDYPNLKKIRWNIDEDKPDLTYYKPEILIDALQYGSTMCFMDCDIVLSKRFDVNKLENSEFDFPLASSGPQEYVWRWESFGNTIIRYDEKKLMEYFGIDERSCPYLWASMISYNINCLDFLEEWKSILLNPYLLKRRKEFFPFREETAFNITLWKRRITNYLDLVFFNTVSFDSFLSVETSKEGKIPRHEEYTLTNLDPRLYETCWDFANVMFYHGFKPGLDLERTVDWMKSNL